MKKFIGKSRECMNCYWKERMHSKCKKMSRGASHVDKIISWARGENWRGNRKKKK